jgi:hypothetical protein
MVEVQHDLGRHFKSLRFRIVLVFDASSAGQSAAPGQRSPICQPIIGGGESAIKTRGEMLEFCVILSFLLSLFVRSPVSRRRVPL